VAQVLAGGQRDDGLRTAFTAQWQADAKGLPRAIDISYSGTPILPAGTYDLYLDLQPSSTGPQAPRLKLTITRPPPGISVYPRVLVTRTVWLPLFDRFTTEDASPQILQETSKKSGATGLTIQSVAPAAMGTTLSTGSLAFTNVPSRSLRGSSCRSTTRRRAASSWARPADR